MCIDIDLLFDGGPVVCKLSPNQVHTDLLFNCGPMGVLQGSNNGYSFNFKYCT